MPRSTQEFRGEAEAKHNVTFTISKRTNKRRLRVALDKGPPASALAGSPIAVGVVGGLVIILSFIGVEAGDHEVEPAPSVTRPCGCREPATPAKPVTPHDSTQVTQTDVTRALHASSPPPARSLELIKAASANRFVASRARAVGPSPPGDQRWRSVR